MNDRPNVAAMRRLQKGHDSVIVSYERSDGLHANTIGHGATLDERVHDADAQLPPGEWKRTAVSTPASIFADMKGRVEATADNPNWRGTVFVRHERKVVVVP